MKLTLLVALALTLAACSTQNDNVADYNRGINVIPQPLQLTPNQGNFTLGKQANFVVHDDDAKAVAEFFIDKLTKPTGLKLALNATVTTGSIELLIDQAVEHDEGYQLQVTATNVTVKAKTTQGLFYGLQTLLQLLPAEVESMTKVNNVEWTIPCVTITDQPRFKHRGMMIDACRHFMPVNDVKKQIDVMAMIKLNQLHFHLTDDQGWRIESKKYPLLTEVGAKRVDGDGTIYGGFYTQDELKDIVDYAKQRFINVIPEVELPGHELAAISAYPFLSCSGEQTAPRFVWGVEDVVLCAGKESTFEFFENVIEEILPIFPSEYFHIGGDECPKICWKKCTLCQQRIKNEKLKDEHELQSYFVQRFEKFLAQHGKKIIGWDEILEGGLAPTATVMSWRGEEGGIAAACLDHDVIMTPGKNGLYLDQFQGDPKIEPVSIGGYTTLEKVYQYNPVPDTLVKLGKEKYVLGIQGNVWAEYLYSTELMEYRAYPRLLAVSEIAWTQPDKKDFTDFARRVENAYVRLDGHNINYHIPQPEQVDGSCNFVAFVDSVTLAFKTTRPVKVVYTTDGSEPNPQSTTYTSPITFTETGVLKIRSVLSSGKMSKTRNITVEKQSFAAAQQPGKTEQGLWRQYVKGFFLQSSELDKATDWKADPIKDTRELTNIEKIAWGAPVANEQQYAAIANGFIDIPDDGVYYFSSDLEEVWINGKLLINNQGETKRYSRNDKSIALAKGLHEVKAVFLGNAIGGWPTNWNDGKIEIRKSDEPKFARVKTEQWKRLSGN